MKEQIEKKRFEELTEEQKNTTIQGFILSIHEKEIVVPLNAQIKFFITKRGVSLVAVPNVFFKDLSDFANTLLRANELLPVKTKIDKRKKIVSIVLDEKMFISALGEELNRLSKRS